MVQLGIKVVVQRCRGDIQGALSRLSWCKGAWRAQRSRMEQRGTEGAWGGCRDGYEGDAVEHE